MFTDLLGLGNTLEGSEIKTIGGKFILNEGILRQEGMVSDKQKQTEEAFAYKWHRLDSYDNETSLTVIRDWLYERYGINDEASRRKYFPDGLKLLDAGCGAGVTASLLIAERLNHIHYLGADISRSVDDAKARFATLGLKGEFIQCDLMKLPFNGQVFDVVLSEGVLHHTDSVEQSLKYLSGFLREGGYFLFYVYRKKSPVREFTDDFIRQAIAPMNDAEAWEALKPLSRLGQMLGDLNITVDVPEEVPYLGIPKGPIPLQRLFYWHIFKCYYRPGWDIEAMNHINFDWFRPANCHRQTKEELLKWCTGASLVVEKLNEQEAGFTVIARKI